MHSSTYFFTCISGTITSYPHDHTHEFFEYAIGKAKNGAQIVLVRKDNLLHYCYVRKIREKQYFGICFRTDHIYNSIADLFRAFDHTYSDIVSAGILLQMDTNGRVIIGTTEFAKESVEVNEQSEHFINSLRLSSRTTQELPPADFSISINDCIELSIEKSTNSEIIDAIKKYCNVYIVKSQAEIARLTEITSIIKRNNEEIRQLQDTITHLDITISNLKKQKNKFKWVLILISIIFIGTIAFFFVMQSKNETIYDLQEENTQLKKHVKSLQKDSTNLEYRLNLTIVEKNKVENALKDSTDVINNLRSDNMKLTYDYQQIERRYEDTQLELGNTRKEATKYLNQLSSMQFGITNIEISNRYRGGEIDVPYGGRIEASKSMYLQARFECYGPENNQKVQFVLKLFYPNGDLIYSSEENRKNGYTYKDEFVLKKGKNTCEFPRRIGGEKRGNYSSGKYRCEIWANGIKLGEKQFTLY